MTRPVLDRLFPVLDPLARITLAVALLVPVWVAVSHLLLPGAELRWAVVNTLCQPQNNTIRERGGYSYGFTVMLSNEGNAATDMVRVYLSPEPEHVDALGDWGGPADLSPTEEGTALSLGPLPAGAEVVVNVFGIAPLGGVTVIESGRRVERTDFDFTEFDDPKARLPGWALTTAALLLLALALEVLGLRGRLRRAAPDRAGAERRAA